MKELAECRVFTASFGTETNTFAPIPTNRASFEECATCSVTFTFCTALASH